MRNQTYTHFKTSVSFILKQSKPFIGSTTYDVLFADLMSMDRFVMSMFRFVLNHHYRYCFVFEIAVRLHAKNDKMYPFRLNCRNYFNAHLFFATNACIDEQINRNQTFSHHFAVVVVVVEPLFLQFVLLMVVSMAATISFDPVAWWLFCIFWL